MGFRPPHRIVPLPDGLRRGGHLLLNDVLGGALDGHGRVAVPAPEDVVVKGAPTQVRHDRPTGVPRLGEHPPKRRRGGAT